MSEARPFKALLSYEKALSAILKSIRPIDRTERVPIRDALGRILAQDITAPIDVPPFDRAAMDGYAVRAADTFGASDLAPLTLQRTGKVYAGDAPDISVGRGECTYIATGGMLPEGADGVVMVEYTEEVEGRVNIHRPVHPGENISKRGIDIVKGACPLVNGIELSGSRIGAAAALGITELEVFARPTVAVAGTGNEVCPLGTELGPGQVYDINTYTMASVVTESGGLPLILGLVEDTREALDEALERALPLADMVVFSGGSSVGERDLLVDTLGKKGKLIFHGVQLKPGKPVLAAIIEEGAREVPCMGFPGYPTACLTSALLFLGPSVRMIARRPSVWPRAVMARLGRRVPSAVGRTQVLTVRLEGDVAHPAFKESGAITSMAEADGYIVIPANVDLVEKNEEVEVFLL